MNTGDSVASAVPQAERAALWEKVQAEVPEMAEFMRQLQAEFGKVVVTYVQVGEVQFGETARPEDLYPITSAYDHELSMLEWEKTIQFRDAKRQRAHLARLAKKEREQRRSK